MAVYTFIDGHYLRCRFDAVMQTLYGEVPPIDFTHVTLGGNRVFYYDALEECDPAKEPQENFDARTAPRRELHQYINRLPNFHVREGYVRRGVKREQKAVDVLLSVDALEHAARGNMSVAVLLAGDLDFEPLVKSLVRLGVSVIIYYSALSVSQELLDVADESRLLTLQDMYLWTFPAFQQTHRPVEYSSPAGSSATSADHLQYFEIERNGQWKSRNVTLYRSREPQYQSFIYVTAGSTLLDHSIFITYQDIDKLGPALELTRGGHVEWESRSIA